MHSCHQIFGRHLLLVLSRFLSYINPFFLPLPLTILFLLLLHILQLLQMLQMAATFVLISILFPLLLCFFWKIHKNNRIPNKKLPPGSMGWPLIGETFHFYSQDLTFFFRKQKRFHANFSTTATNTQFVGLLY